MNKGEAKFVQEFLERHYSAGENPLPGLRSTFPQFSWEFHKIPDNTPVNGFEIVRERILREADFIWDAYGPGNDNCNFVIARLIGAAGPPRMIYCSCSFYDLEEVHSMDSYVDELTKMGARELGPD